MAIGSEIAKLFVTVGANTKEFFDKMGEADSLAGKFSSGMKKTFSAVGKAAVVGMAAVGTATVKFGVDSFNAAKDFESAFAGVKKTVDETSTISYEDLEKSIRDMSKTLPSTAAEIAGVAEIAGQLGIETENVMAFTKAMLDLGNTTNLTAEDGASMLAQFANITGMDQTEFDRLGSTIVALGNNMATTEADIVSMSLRLAGAGVQVGMTEAEIASFAAALSSVGIESEAGGSAFSKVMVNMQLATKLGGEELENFAMVAGMSAEEFAAAYEEDAAGALITFVEGLGTLEERGMDSLVVLDEMGITEVRMRDALLRSSNAAGLLSEAMDIGTVAWDENSAMAEEANKRYETTESQMQILKNTVNDLAIGFGQQLLPSVNTVIQGLNGILSDGFQVEDIGAIGDLVTDTIMGAVKGISSALPEVISVIVGFINEAITVLVEILPEVLPALIDGAIAILQGIMDALSNNADMLGTAATDIIMALVDFIVGNLAKFIEVCYKLILALAKGIAAAIPTLLPTIIQLIMDIVNMALQNLDLIIGVALDIILALVWGLMEALPTLIAYIPELIKTIVMILIENLALLIEAALQIIIALAGGLIAAIPTLILAIPDIIFAIIEAFMDTDWLKIGTDILLGIGEGIVKGISGLVDSALKACKDLGQGIKDFFGIASPSKLMMGYGENISKGLAVGIEAMSDLPKKALDGLVPTDLEATIGTNFDGGKTPFEAMGGESFNTGNQSVDVSGTIRHEGINDKGQLIAVVEQTIKNKLQWESMLAGG